MLNFLFGSKQECPELRHIVKQLSAANEKMKSRASSAQKVGESLLALVQSEAPAFAMFFEKIKDIYSSLSTNYQTAALEQSRVIEDLNDIIVRYPIFQRISHDREHAKKRYEIALNKCKEIKNAAKVDPNAETSSFLESCRLERASIAAVLIEKSELYLDYRTRFNRFVQNRTKSAWMRYGASIERTAKTESELMTQLAQICAKLRDNVDAPQKLLETAETALSDDKINVSDIDKFDVVSDSFEEDEEEETVAKEVTKADFES